jgi:hypothetical protein
LRIIRGLVFVILIFTQAAPEAALASPPADKPGPASGTKKPARDVQRPGLAADIALSTSGEDAYGYTWNNTGGYLWSDPNQPGWTKAVFSDRDEGATDPIDLGFAFKFYENTYTQIHLTTNGLVTFGGTSLASRNDPIPFIGEPNDFIAPFWADLYVGPVPAPPDTPVYTGTVSYRTFTDYFVIAYQKVIRFGALPTDFLTFEVYLYHNGNICYSYSELNTPLDYTTVGIEDGDGVDGLQYSYNNTGLNVKDLMGLHSLCFIRPAPRRAVKVLPHYNSSLVAGGQSSFKVKLRNIGEVGADKYDITYQKSNPAWTVSLYDQSGTIPLVDSSQNGKPDTGADPIEQGNYFTATVKINAPTTAIIGSSAVITLTATSVYYPACHQSVRLQTAISASFAQALVNNETGIELRMVSASSQRRTPISNDFTGSVLSVSGRMAENYALVWEDNEDKIVPISLLGPSTERLVSYTNLDVARLNRYGALLKEPSYLTDNDAASTPYWQINDKSPAVALAANGRVGIAWVREIISNTALLPTDKRNYNIYFTVLEAGSSQAPMFTPINITGNTSWRGGSDIYNTPYFNNPRISVTSDGRFVLSWSDERTLVSGQQGNILMAIYDSNGSVISGAKQVTAGSPGGDYYKDPGLASLGNGRVLLAYAHLDSKSAPVSIDFAVFNSAGGSVKANTSLASPGGSLPTASQLGSGKILVAWTGSEGQIDYAMLDGSSYLRIKGPLQLASPDGMLGDYVSITQDGQGRAILTWEDTDFYQQLYYAFMDQDGNLITSPLGFQRVSGSFYLVINNGGNGLAPYAGAYWINFPLARRY